MRSNVYCVDPHELLRWTDLDGIGVVSQLDHSSARPPAENKKAVLARISRRSHVLDSRAPCPQPELGFDAPFTTSHARLNTSTAVTNSKRSMVPDVCVFLQDTRLHNVVCSTVNCDIVRELGELGAGVRRMFAPLFEMIDEHWHLPAFCCYCGAFHRLTQRPN